MIAEAGIKPMAKRGRPKSSDRKDATARVDAGVIARAQMVAKARGITLAEYLSETLRGPVDRDFLNEMKQLEMKRDDKK